MENSQTDLQEFSDDIQELLEKIEHWRNTRIKQGPMPEDLWQQAVSLARIHGIYAICRDLHLNYEALKKRVEQAPIEENENTGNYGEFVELNANLFAKTENHETSVVELQGSDGSKLTVRLAKQEGLDLPGLVDAFLRAQS